jgi:hypothetical protein
MGFEWMKDEQGRVVLPVSTGFSLGVLQPPLIAVQVRYEEPAASDTAEEQRLQFQLPVEGAREFAAALLKAVEAIEHAPEIGRLN